jgi:hypothetical protein
LNAHDHTLQEYCGQQYLSQQINTFEKLLKVLHILYERKLAAYHEMNTKAMAWVKKKKKGKPLKHYIPPKRVVGSFPF